MSRSKRITDLYVKGSELVLNDGTVLYLQVMSKFERQEATKDSAVARSRLIMALKDVGSDDFELVKAEFAVKGREKIIAEMLNARTSEWSIKAVQQLQVEKDWAERWQILDHVSADEIMARDEDDPERRLLIQLNADYLAEVTKRVEDDTAFEKAYYERMDDVDLADAWETLWLEREGNKVAWYEYQCVENYFSTRECDAVREEDGTFAKDAHAKCAHPRLFESVDEARNVPEELWNEIRGALMLITMEVRDARFSPRQGTSSTPSPLPSTPADSEVSTSEDVSSTPLGPSPLPLTTPSPS